MISIMTHCVFCLAALPHLPILQPLEHEQDIACVYVLTRQHAYVCSWSLCVCACRAARAARHTADGRRSEWNQRWHEPGLDVAQVFGTTHLSSPSSFVALSIASYRYSSPIHSADKKNEFIFDTFKIY